MTEPLIFVDSSHPNVRVVTLNRPDKRNALSIELMLELQKIILNISNEPDQRAIILKGAGPVFCAGLDLYEALDDESARTSADTIARTFQILHDCHLVTIAAVHGGAFAGGAGLMSACDLAVAAEGTRFAFPETRRGLVPALVAALLKPQIGDRHLRELLLLGEPIDTQTAHRMGLINRVVPSNELDATALKMASQASQGTQNAIHLTKELLSHLRPQTFETHLRKALNFHLKARSSEEAKSRIETFFNEKRE